MNKTDDLFRLIKSMSRTEKGYFKKFVQGFSSGKENNYVLLFDLIDKAEAADDKAISKAFAAQTKKKVNLRALRPYLFQLLLKSLRLYYEKDNYRFDATNRVNEVEILLDKGLDDLAYRRSAESVQHCAKYELNELKLLFLSYEHYAFGQIPWEEIPLVREKAYNHLKHTIRQLEYNTDIRHIELKLTYLFNTYFPTTDPARNEEVESLMTHNCLKDISKLTALDAVLGFHNVWRSYYSYKGELQKSYEHAHAIVQKIEDRDAINKTFVGRYVRALASEAKLATDLNRPEETLAVLAKMKKKVPVESPGDEHWLELTWMVSQIHFLKTFPTYLPDTKKLADRALVVINRPEGFYEGYKLLLTFDLAVIYFHLGDCNKALDLLSVIINRKPEGSRIMYVHARLLQIVIHYDLGNKLLLPSLMKSTFRFMAKADVQFEFERIILKFFTRVLRPSNHVVLSEELAWMKAEFEKASTNEYEKAPLKVFNYVNWLTAKSVAKK
ncbi:MAG: hypothetical protein U0V74_05920 [Chitinophagales bacterium]